MAPTLFHCASTGLVPSIATNTPREKTRNCFLNMSHLGLGIMWISAQGLREQPVIRSPSYAAPREVYRILSNVEPDTKNGSPGRIAEAAHRTERNRGQLHSWTVDTTFARMNQQRLAPGLQPEDRPFLTVRKWTPLSINGQFSGFLKPAKNVY